MPQPGVISLEMATASIDRSLKRMGTDSLDLLQFNWLVVSNAIFLFLFRFHCFDYFLFYGKKKSSHKRICVIKKLTTPFYWTKSVTFQTINHLRNK